MKWLVAGTAALIVLATCLLVWTPAYEEERLRAVWAAADAGDTGPLVVALGDDSPAVRAAGVRGLAAVDGELANAELSAFVARSTSAWRRESLVAVADSGRTDPRARGFVSGLLEDETPSNRAAAALALGAMAPLSPEELERLAGLLRDADSGVRETAVRGLAEQGWAAVSTLTFSLPRVDESTARAVRRRLFDITGEHMADDAWGTWLGGPVGTMRRLAHEGSWPEARDDIVAGLRHPLRDVRTESILALARLAPPDEGLSLAERELTRAGELDRASSLWEPRGRAETDGGTP